MAQCSIPISAHYTVYDGDIVDEEYHMSDVDAAMIANLLLDEFGIDFDANSVRGEDHVAA